MNEIMQSQKKSNKTLAIVIVVIIILLAGVALAAYYMVGEGGADNDAVLPAGYTQTNTPGATDYQPGRGTSTQTDSSASIENDLNAQSVNSLDQTTY